MVVLESLVRRSIQITVSDVIGVEAFCNLGHLVELSGEVLALLVRALGCGRQRRELVVYLLQQLPQLAKVKCARVILIEFGEQLVEALQVVGCLGKSLLHILGDLAPVTEVQLDSFGVMAALPSCASQEGNDVISKLFCTVEQSPMA